MSAHHGLVRWADLPEELRAGGDDLPGKVPPDATRCEAASEEAGRAVRCRNPKSEGSPFCWEDRRLHEEFLRLERSRTGRIITRLVECKHGGRQ